MRLLRTVSYEVSHAGNRFKMVSRFIAEHYQQMRGVIEENITGLGSTRQC